MILRKRHESFRKVHRRREGAVIVEFAVIAPIIVLICMATIELCSLYYLRQTCKLAAYEGCRIGLTTKGSKGLVENQAKRVLNSRKIFGYDIDISPNPNTLKAGDLLTVRITAPPKKNLPLKGWLVGGADVDVQVVMMSEQ
jgi:hypothetical protein